jgi:hypothetical protein
VAGQLGYCGLDRRRAPLTGEEIRGCWQAAPGRAVADDARPVDPARRAAADGRPIQARGPRLDFVPVDPVVRPPAVAASPPAASSPPSQTPGPVLRFILWEDVDA